MPIQAMLGSRFFFIALFKQIRLLLSIFSLNGEFLIVALTAEYINNSFLFHRQFLAFKFLCHICHPLLNPGAHRPRPLLKVLRHSVRYVKHALTLGGSLGRRNGIVKQRSDDTFGQLRWDAVADYGVRQLVCLRHLVRVGQTRDSRKYPR